MSGPFELLKTHQISPAVIDIIETTEKHCYLVTPYIKPWPVLERSFKKASEAGTKLTLILWSERDSQQVGRRLNSEYGFEVIVLDRLHTKLYLNEKQAVVGSMNLYDSSNERNYELAVLTTNRHAVRQLREEIVQRDLLALEPVEHLKGSFHQAEVERLRALEQFRADLKDRGFCVACGTKIDFDESSGSILSPRRVRCKPCWAKVPFVEEPHRWRIRHCHYCGEDLDSVLTQPFHHRCEGRLKEFKELLD